MATSTRVISLNGTMASNALAAAFRGPAASPVPRLTSAAMLLFGLVCGALLSASAVASNVKFVGNATYTYNGNTAVLTAEEIKNFDASGSSGPLQLELWAVAAPFNGGPLTGYKLAEYTLGQLVAGFSYSNVSSGAVPFTPPPAGTWTYTILVTEFTPSGPVDDGCLSIHSAHDENYTYTACMHASGWIK